MSEIKLGELIPEGTVAERDAVHVAVVPCIVGEDYMSPGQRVKLAYGTQDVVISAMYDHANCVGVIDPFVGCNIVKGDRVYVFLNPGTITGLRHHWSHPVFDSQPKVESEAETWLRKFAEKWNFDYDEMIEIAARETGDAFPDAEYIVASGNDLHTAGELGPDHDEFWRQIEALTGYKFDEKHRELTKWSCSC